MSDYIVILTYWKGELSSEENDKSVIALAEILQAINEAIFDEVFEKISEIYLNRDLCHFLCELLSNDELHNTLFINTIVCYLSENSNFYKTQFFRIMKIYQRLLTSMNESSQINSSDYKYIDGIFKTMSLIIMR